MLTFARQTDGHWVDSGHMKIFLSWSKEPSKSVAIVLRTWLQDVIQSLEPWMSDQDIQSGERSLVVISAELQERDFGILILTPENQLQPWINYEAGALSKMVGSSRVAPFLFNFKLSELLPGPLSQFHGREATEEGTRRLLQDINAAMPNPLTEPQLKKAFDKNWPDLAAELQRITETHAANHLTVGEAGAAPKRTDGEKLDEILVMLRDTLANPIDRTLRNIRRHLVAPTSYEDDPLKDLIDFIGGHDGVVEVRVDPRLEAIFVKFRHNYVETPQQLDDEIGGFLKNNKMSEMSVTYSYQPPVRVRS